MQLVYGAATHSNNNDWLRRKLYEGEPPKGAPPAAAHLRAPLARLFASGLQALTQTCCLKPAAIGAAPIKAATKTKVRKPAPKPKKPLASELMFHSSSNVALSALERRSKRATRG